MIHNNKYDYTKTKYEHSHKKVKIICPEHGEFEQSPCNHIYGKQGCPKCGGTNKLTIVEFIKRSNKIHNYEYEYDFVELKNSKTKVKIICKNHGIFEQTPNVHLNGSICPQCAIENLRRTKDFLDKSKNKYLNKYDYSLVDYKRVDRKVKIICHVHGVFEQRPDHHLKRGCPICEGNMKLTTSQIKILFNEIHENKFDYSLMEYKGDKVKIKIICPVHGIFEQTPAYHKIGNGCPMCNESKGERFIRKFLKSHNINFIHQKKFYNCKDINNLIFDFYLPDKNLCIEYDGEQHFKINEFFGGIDRLKDQQKKDKIKTNFCNENGMKLIRIKYNEKINDKLITLI